MKRILWIAVLGLIGMPGFGQIKMNREALLPKADANEYRAKLQTKGLAEVESLVESGKYKLNENLLLFTPEVPITFKRLDRMDGKYQTTDDLISANFGASFMWVRVVDEKEKTVSVEPMLFAGASMGFALFTGDDIGTANFNVNAFVGFKDIAVNWGWDYGAGRGYVGFAYQFPLFQIEKDKAMVIRFKKS